jgi:hypothetical protein
MPWISLNFFLFLPHKCTLSSMALNGIRRWKLHLRIHSQYSWLDYLLGELGQSALSQHIMTPNADALELHSREIRSAPFCNLRSRMGKVTFIPLKLEIVT